jgi:hypothetical protein
MLDYKWSKIQDFNGNSSIQQEEDPFYQTWT